MASAHGALSKELHCLQDKKQGMDQKAMPCLLPCPVRYKVPGMPTCQVLDSHKEDGQRSEGLAV